MLTNSLMNLFRRPATRLYPQVPFEPVPRLRGHTEYDMTKCIMCLLCSKRCPNEAIETDREARQHKIFRMRCMACGLCVDTCPTDTITMVQAYSPPAYHRTVDTYVVKITEHQRIISELPPFVRKLEPGEKPEPAFTPPPAVVAAPAQTEARLKLEDVPASCVQWPVRDIMMRNVVSVTPDVRIVEVARLLLENDISGVPVVDTQRRVVGVVTERDIMSAPRGKVPLTLRHLFSRIFLGDGHPRPGEEGLAGSMEAPVSSIMTAPAITIKEDLTVEDAARIMDERNVNRIPVVGRDDRLAGIVTRSDIVRALTRQPRGGVRTPGVPGNAPKEGTAPPPRKGEP